MKNAAQTLKAKSKRPARTSCELQERMDLHQSTVDRETCVIRNVKILGKSSLNKHGMTNVTGTDYLPSVHAKAKQFYEGVEVNIGHPPRNSPDAERSPSDRNGVLFNVKENAGETYGDLQLIPSHPMTKTLLDCAENPRLHGQFALSHNAKGYGEVRNGRYQITDLELVRSVDVVTRGGCNRTLFENLETQKMTTPFKTVLESAEAAAKERFTPLLDMFEDLGEILVEAPDAGSGSGKPGCEECLNVLIESIVADANMPASDKKDKIIAANKAILESGPKSPKPPPDDEEEEEEEEKEEENRKKGKPGDVQRQSALESAEREELLSLRNERQARNVCESLEFFDATPIQIKAIAGLTSQKDRVALAKDFKSLKTPPKKSVQPHTSTSRAVLESSGASKAKADKKAFADSILG